MSKDSDNKNKLTQTKEKLDSVSSSFCAAKWKQVTMHLQNGHTHSCHHPRTHIIPIEELKNNYKALHNTNYKKQQRKLMLEGERPTECDYCWRVEDNTKNNVSDRVYKSASDWALPYIDDITKKPWDDDVDPSYVEVNFSSVCNFKCSYCSPVVSSQWMEEIEKYGPYPTDDNFNNLEWFKAQKMMPIPNREVNPYSDAFWEWWPSMYKSLKNFRITGGEPLLSKNTFRVLDYIIENPNTDLEFSINTNMNPPEEIFSSFLEKIKIIVNQQKVKKFRLFTSAEAHGKQSDYIRFGMNYDAWLNNIHRVYKEIPSIEFTVMSTYNILSIPSYTKFLKDILYIKSTYARSDESKTPLVLDIPYLRFPQHQALFIADDFLVDMIRKQVSFMYDNTEDKENKSNGGFYQREADKLKRILNLAEEALISKNELVDSHRKNFIRFVDEHDKRRNTNFLETFPELEYFYLNCKQLLNK